MAQRRTNDEMFDMGTWVASTLAQIDAALDRIMPEHDFGVIKMLATFKDFLIACRDARNWTALEELRSHWQVNQDGATQHERGA